MDKITVLCPNAHRVTVSVSRHASLAEVLEEVCKKKNFEAKNHVLQHHGRTLDLSLSVHLANLPRNGFLEMVPAEVSATAGKVSNVNICLQLESGERIMQDFVPDDTLADIFNHAKDAGKIPDQELDDGTQPVIVYMRREFIGLDDFAKNSLQRLGLSQGRAILRLVFRHPKSMGQQASVYNMKEKETPSEKEERHVPWRPMRKDSDIKVGLDITTEVISSMSGSNVTPKISQPEKAMEVEAEVNEQTSTLEVQEEKITPSPEPREESLEEEIPVAMVIAEEEEEEVLNYLDETAVIFKRQSGKSIKANVDKNLDDDFFELTIEDAMRIQADLRKQIRELNSDEPLMTEDMRKAVKEGQKLSLLNRHPKTVVRIQFPDLFVLQGIFLSGQTIGDVEEFVKRFTVTADVKFFLLIPPNTRLDPSSTLLESECVPSSLVRFIPENFKLGTDPETGSFLRKDVLENISNAKGANRALQEAGVVRMSQVDPSSHDQSVKKAKLDTTARLSQSGPTPSSSAAKASESSTPKPTTSTGVVPKWFKPLGPKK